MELLFNNLLICTTLIVGILCAPSIAENCKQRSSTVPGECKPLTSCSSLQKKLEKHVLNIAGFVEEHGCGVDHDTGTALVCCPKIIAVGGGVFSATTPPANESNPRCGRRQVNERGAKWPFAVGLGSVRQVDTDNSWIHLHCNGALISPRWVITAANCIVDYLITVAVFGLGYADWSKTMHVPVILFRAPDPYDPVRDLNGVALLKLARDVTPDEGAQYACLPPTVGYDHVGLKAVLYFSKFYDGTEGGGLEIKNQFRNKIDLSQCRRSATLPVSPSVNHICMDGIRDCNLNITRPILVGPGGTPDLEFIILGVGGLSKDSCSSDVTLFTSVSNYLPWINSVINPSDVTNAVIDSAYELMTRLLMLPNLFMCGRRNVLNGVQFPFMVSLGSFHPATFHFRSHCTGVLIETQWVLTDARCVQANTIEMIAIGYLAEEISSREYVPVEKIIVHPDRHTTHNTVTLVKLRTKIQYTPNKQPVCTKHTNSFDNNTIVYSLSAGYSFDNKGQPTLDTGLDTLGRLQESDCRDSLFIPYDAHDNLYICTSGTTACNFILTPPVLLEQELIAGSFVVIGVGGDNTDNCNGKQMGFVRVSPYKDWIWSIVYGNMPKTEIDNYLQRNVFIPAGSSNPSDSYGQNQPSQNAASNSNQLFTELSNNPQFRQTSQVITDIATNLANRNFGKSINGNANLDLSGTAVDDQNEPQAKLPTEETVQSRLEQRISSDQEHLIDLRGGNPETPSTSL